MFLFLQNVRCTLIPTIVVPVALLGTCAALLLAGFSINVLTMFGMVLAIGILVDDAIVVVENVERIMGEEGLPPREATAKAMGQITGAIVGITAVLVAVFVPLAFFPGSVGVIYRQFAVSMATSIALSAFLALSLTPALCATLLKPVEAGHGRGGAFAGSTAASGPARWPIGPAWRASCAGRSGRSSSTPCWWPPSLGLRAGDAVELPADRGPGLRHRRCADPAGLGHRAHARRGQAHRGALRPGARRRQPDAAPRLRLLGPGPERGSTSSG